MKPDSALLPGAGTAANASVSVPGAGSGPVDAGKLVHTIVIIGVVLIIGVCGLLGANIHHERADAIVSAKVNAQNLARVIEVETEHVFYAVDVTLRGLGDAIRLAGSSGRPRERDIHLLLRQRLSQLPFAAKLLIVDRGGSVVHASDSMPARRTDLSDRAYFTVQRDNPGHGLYIGPPMPGGTAGKIVLNVSRPWTGGDGRFQGVLVAVLDTAKIEELYASIDIGKRGAVNLALRDGTLLARGPYGNADAGASMADTPVFREHLARADAGTFEDAGPAGGARRIVSYRAIPGLPLVICVELDEDEALASWLHGARIEGIMVLAFMLIMALLIVVLVAELRRRELLAARLADSERRYRVLFDLLPLPALVRDQQTLKVIAVNEAAVKTYLYPREEFMRLTTWDIRPPEDYARYRQDLEAMRGKPELKRIRGQHRRKDGTLMQVEINTFDLMFGGRPARLSVINDVTERKRAEAALRLYVERLEALRRINTSILEARYPAEIASTGLDHLLRVVPCWSATVRVIDFTKRESIVLATRPDKDSAFAAPQRLSFDEYGAVGLAALKQGRASIVPDIAAVPNRSALLEHRYQQGMRCFVRMPLMVESTLVGVLNLASDKANYFTADHLEFTRTIADHLALALQGAVLREKIQRQADELEERVTERTAQLATANEELEAFSYSVSHDLRAPLRSINGFGKLLQEKNAAQLDDSGRGFLQRILAASERMSDLIDDLLSLSRISRAEMRRAEVDLSALAAQVAADIAGAYPDGPVAVSIAPNLTTNADRGLVRILLENLLGNAWKYSRRAARPQIEIGQVERNGQMAYFVRDNGAGFDMAYADKLFGVFQRLHSQSEFPGTGIGLATVRRIVQRHGGEVWAEGAVNQGATFYFTLG